MASAAAVIAQQYQPLYKKQEGLPWLIPEAIVFSEGLEAD